MPLVFQGNGFAFCMIRDLKTEWKVNLSFLKGRHMIVYVAPMLTLLEIHEIVKLSECINSQSCAALKKGTSHWGEQLDSSKRFAIDASCIAWFYRFMNRLPWGPCCPPHHRSCLLILDPSSTTKKQAYLEKAPRPVLVWFQPTPYGPLISFENHPPQAPPNFKFVMALHKPPFLLVSPQPLSQ